MTISRRGFVRLIGGGTVLAASGLGLTQCDQMPAGAIAAWRGPDPAEPDIRKRMIGWAQLAPNPHNRQPWLLDLREAGVITLYCDGTRLLPHTDPFARQIMIGHGAFLELLVLAAAAQGHRAEIEYFPAGAFAQDRIDRRPVARISVRADSAAKADALFAEIPRRRSNKQTFDTARQVPDDQLAALARSVEGGGLGFASVAADPLRGRLREIVQAAWEIEARTARTMGESIDLMRLSAAEIDWYRDGISLHGPMFWWGSRLGFIDKRSLLDSASTAWQQGVSRYRKLHDSAMAFAWLTSPDNSRLSQLQAGRAYARLNLTAGALGVAMHPLSQVLQEYKEMAPLQRQFLADIGADPGHTVQMLVRLGYAPPAPATPRREFGDLLLG